MTDTMAAILAAIMSHQDQLEIRKKSIITLHFWPKSK
jgi:hypothetical protein